LPVKAGRRNTRAKRPSRGDGAHHAASHGSSRKRTVHSAARLRMGRGLKRAQICVRTGWGRLLFHAARRTETSSGNSKRSAKPRRSAVRRPTSWRFEPCRRLRAFRNGRSDRVEPETGSEGSGRSSKPSFLGSGSGGAAVRIGCEAGRREGRGSLTCTLSVHTGRDDVRRRRRRKTPSPRRRLPVRSAWDHRSLGQSLARDSSPPVARLGAD